MEKVKAIIEATCKLHTKGCLLMKRVPKKFNAKHNLKYIKPLSSPKINVQNTIKLFDNTMD